MGSLSTAMGKYFSNPKAFVFPAFLQPFFFIVISFFILGLGFLAMFVLNYLNIQSQAAVVIIFLLCVFLIVFFSAGIKGALFKGFSTALEGRRFLLEDFSSYFMQKSLLFFVISIIKMLFLGIIAGIIWLVYSYMPDLFANQVFLAILAIFSLFFIGLIGYLLSFSYISAAVNNYTMKNAFNAIFKESLLKNMKNLLRTFPLYLGYGIVVLLGFVPVLNIFTHFILYPIFASALILNYKNCR